MNEDGYFEVYSKGEQISGYVSFWFTGKKYYRQCIGLSEPKKCSKELYEKAKSIYEEQQQGNYEHRI